ncbi:restriction endonuclease subunit S [Pseudomonas rubra]|uniref:restriction endonuclease subunit S n=1 Tax=Pseudomonas rubra TaxID=2942627 RepID=UPI0023605806|nr:restriction endonuclease subunit S [Pseudomonas rubra]MDD1158102.1 restriction endonuclease subunit S [Pseudomonas rubra]
MAPKEQTFLGDYFTSSREKGKVGLPLLSVTLNNGIVQRNDLERKTETKITPEEHLLVRKGDIAYNMMRVWQGALGRADSDGIVSPAYVVLRAKKDVDSKYAEYLFNTAKMIYFFWAYSYGITNDRLRLYFNDFKKIPVNLPCIIEQKKIAKILLTWDHALKKTEQLLKNSQQQKKALMQQLLGILRSSQHRSSDLC